MDLSFVFTVDLLIAFLTLFVLELVLGVDNVIFISILAGKLPVEQQAKARNLGLSLAMVIRVGLLFAAAWIVSLKNDLFTLFGMGFSGRDLILIAGGLFLVYKAVKEIHAKLEGHDEHGSSRPGRSRSARSSCRSCCWTSCSRSTRSSLRWAWSTACW